MVDKVAMGQVLFLYFGSSLSVSIRQGSTLIVICHRRCTVLMTSSLNNTLKEAKLKAMKVVELLTVGLNSSVRWKI
jgi:hypothetical protein